MKSYHLILEISCSEIDFLRLDYASYMFHFRKTAVILPLPLAAPAHESKDTKTVAKVIYSVILSPYVLETDCVHIHIHDISHLSLD